MAQVGLGITVASVRQRRSDEREESIAALLEAAALGADTRPGNVLLAITDQHTVKYDGWAQTREARFTARFDHNDKQRNASLIAHELGHLLWTRHHDYDDDCTGDVTPMDVLEGRREAILARRKEVQRETFERRRQYNQAVRGAPKREASPP